MKNSPVDRLLNESNKKFQPGQVVWRYLKQNDGTRTVLSTKFIKYSNDRYKGKWLPDDDCLVEATHRETGERYETQTSDRILFASKEEAEIAARKREIEGAAEEARFAKSEAEQKPAAKRTITTDDPNDYCLIGSGNTGSSMDGMDFEEGVTSFVKPFKGIVDFYGDENKDGYKFLIAIPAGKVPVHLAGLKVNWAADSSSVQRDLAGHLPDGSLALVGTTDDWPEHTALFFDRVVEHYKVKGVIVDGQSAYDTEVSLCIVAGNERAHKAAIEEMRENGAGGEEHDDSDEESLSESISKLIKPQ